jgi:hypothetical protein
MDEVIEAIKIDYDFCKALTEDLVREQEIELVKPHVYRKRDYYAGNPESYSFEEEGILEFDRSLIDEVCPIGSATIPDCRGNDLDLAILTKFVYIVREILELEGWELTGNHNDYTGDSLGNYPFWTARKGIYNLILFDDKKGYDLYKLANELCVRLCLKERGDRIAVFDAVTGDRYSSKEESS